MYKAFREDKLVFKMREFVEKELGHSFAHPLPVLMDDVFKGELFCWQLYLRAES